MISFNLKCRREHVFAAWFPSTAAYEKQVKAGKVLCPVCADKKVSKAPMAPAVRNSSPATQEATEAADALRALRAVRQHVEDNSDYVGPRFAEEARRMHYGETDKRNIHGETTDKEAESLQDEGIDFSRIPWVPLHDA
jgi:hypothetical protein